jgi:predicted O-methyltransferase YrrM
MSFKWERRVLQNLDEFDRFVKLMRVENIKSYLEIGAKYGGTWWRMIHGLPLPDKARTVAVDLPHGDASFKETEPYLVDCHKQLKARGYDAHLFLGDSTNPDIVKAVRDLGPFDLCFIDANHTEPYIRQDWANYGAISRIVAFHDIGWQARPEPSTKMPIHVPEIWNELKQPFRHTEIKLDKRDNGIGILWRA